MPGVTSATNVVPGLTLILPVNLIRSSSSHLVGIYLFTTVIGVLLIPSLQFLVLFSPWFFGWWQHKSTLPPYVPGLTPQCLDRRLDSVSASTQALHWLMRLTSDTHLLQRWSSNSGSLQYAILLFAFHHYLPLFCYFSNFTKLGVTHGLILMAA
jgi:hypothetical protein